MIELYIDYEGNMKVLGLVPGQVLRVHLPDGTCKLLSRFGSTTICKEEKEKEK